MGSSFQWDSQKGSKMRHIINCSFGKPPMTNLDMEPLNIMGDWYQVERKPTQKPPVVEILFFFRKKHRCFKLTTALTYFSRKMCSHCSFQLRWGHTRCSGCTSLLSDWIQSCSSLGWDRRLEHKSRCCRSQGDQEMQRNWEDLWWIPSQGHRQDTPCSFQDTLDLPMKKWVWTYRSWDNLTPRTIWHLGQFDTSDNLTP